MLGSITRATASEEPMPTVHDQPRGSLAELAGLFLKLGTIGFGGPAAHIAMQRDEVVGRRGWLTEQEFLDLLGATNFIPGPNSTEMAIHIGYRRAGWPGLLVAGICFITPAALIVLALAWLYVGYGQTPTATSVLYGIKPVVVAIIAVAIYQLGRTAIKGVLFVLVGLAVFVLALAGVNELALLAGGALLVAVVANRARLRRPPGTLAVLPLALSAPALLAQAGAADRVELPRLFWEFLKFGSVVFGSGYVLLAFLHGDLVDRLGWLTDQQLADAITVGQLTPGPVFTTATFIGYLLAGLPGAAVATIGIFGPSFVLVAATNPLVARVRRSSWAGSLLDGVNIAAVGLMAAVTLALGRAALVDPLTVALAVAALVVLVRWKLNSAWLIAAGAAVGVLHLLA
jgi:chromate transporter